MEKKDVIDNAGNAETSKIIHIKYSSAPKPYAGGRNPNMIVCEPPLNLDLLKELQELRLQKKRKNGKN